MKVREWMSAPVHTVKPLDSIARAREILERERVNQLPVVVNGRLVGIVTDRDLRDAFPSVMEIAGSRSRRRQAAAAAPEEIAVEAVMSRDPFTIGPDEPIEKAAWIMRRERIGALPVLEQRRLVGLIARSDLLEALIALAKEWRRLQPREVSEPQKAPGR
jgi:acetoin utilization protein AcuB